MRASKAANLMDDQLLDPPRIILGCVKRRGGTNVVLSSGFKM